MTTQDKEVFRLKILSDYNKYLNECVSSNTILDQRTIADYLEDSYYHEPISINS